MYLYKCPTHRPSVRCHPLRELSLIFRQQPSRPIPRQSDRLHDARGVKAERLVESTQLQPVIWEGRLGTLEDVHCAMARNDVGPSGTEGFCHIVRLNVSSLAA